MYEAPETTARSWKRAVAILALSTSVVGCASATGDAHPTPASPDVPPSSGGTSGLPTGSVPIAEQRSPFDQLIEDSLGLGLDELALASELMRLDEIESCMSDAGWTIDEQVFEHYRADIDNPDQDDIDGYIKEIEFDSGKLTVSPLWSETGFSEQYEACTDTAASKVPNPASAATQATGEANDEIYQRVRTDPTVVEADRLLDGCLQQLGFTTESVAEQRNTASEKGFQIVNDFKGGALTADRALDQLGAIRADIDRVEALTAPCFDAHKAVEANAVGAAQQRYLSDHPGFLDGVLEQNRAAAQQLRDFMETHR